MAVSEKQIVRTPIKVDSRIEVREQQSPGQVESSRTPRCCDAAESVRLSGRFDDKIGGDGNETSQASVIDGAQYPNISSRLSIPFDLDLNLVWPSRFSRNSLRLAATNVLRQLRVRHGSVTCERGLHHSFCFVVVHMSS